MENVGFEQGICCSKINKQSLIIWLPEIPRIRNGLGEMH